MFLYVLNPFRGDEQGHATIRAPNYTDPNRVLWFPV